MQPMSTIKVRIAVLANAKGQWCAFGGDLVKDSDAVIEAAAGIDPGEATLSYVTAEVSNTLPEIKGQVEVES